ncbi:MAG: undecaprenyl-diphosphate phosphatase [Dactylosporangium sp.]|nr:undecaprenyl-diphosphate phosphatase [Dactylosporangium sp.]NNJ60476.1 undecaprenyl-diphosphate phosphatase [Dactylosporangium sp.]
MNIWQAIVLGAVEGVTEFLPVSSTGHLTIVEKLLGLQVDDPAITGFTAVIQIGAIAAVLIYFARDIWNMARGVCVGLVSPHRRNTFEFRFGLAVAAGSLPIGVVGLLGKDLITGPLRNLWWVAGALVLWSGVMVFAEWAGPQRRGEKDITLKDGIIIGLAQCLALVPGVSRSGATISIGLLRDIDRVTATRMSFFLGIPALTGAGLFELKDALGGDAVGVPALVVGTAVSFIVAYASIAWLLRFVAHHSLSWFAGYRVAVGLAIGAALAAGTLAAT